MRTNYCLFGRSQKRNISAILWVWPPLFDWFGFGPPYLVESRIIDILGDLKTSLMSEFRAPPAEPGINYPTKHSLFPVFSWIWCVFDVIDRYSGWFAPQARLNFDQNVTKSENCQLSFSNLEFGSPYLVAQNFEGGEQTQRIALIRNRSLIGGHC